MTQPYRHYPRIGTAGRGAMYIHRQRAVIALGKPLPKGAVVHHADGSTSATAQLVICQDNAYHRLLHMRMRVKDAGGDPNTDAVCGQCRTAQPLSAFAPAPAVSTGHSNICHRCAAHRESARRERDRTRINDGRRIDYYAWKIVKRLAQFSELPA